MSIHNIQQMIKSKILITDDKKQLTRQSINHIVKNKELRVKTNKIVSSKNSKKNSDIVIMNMPFINNQYRNLLQDNFISSNHSKDPQLSLHISDNRRHIKQSIKNPIWSNPHISSGLNGFNQSFKKFNSVTLTFDTSAPAANHHHSINKQNLLNSNDESNMLLKRYNSVNFMKFSEGLTINPPNQKNWESRAKFLLNEENSPTIIKTSRLSVPVMEFKPCFKQLLKRNSKIHSKVENKLQKFDFNYQRAISTSSDSRKKAFIKILNVFESRHNREKFARPNDHNDTNPQQNNLKSTSLTQSPQQKPKTSQSINRKSPSKPLPKVQQEQPSCRPWSAEKIQLANNIDNPLPVKQDQDNPLQFYSINEQY